MKTIRGIKTFNSIEIQYYKRLLAFRRQILNAFYDNINIKSFTDAEISKSKQLLGFTKAVNDIIKNNTVAEKMQVLMYKFFKRQIQNNIAQSNIEINLERYYKNDKDILNNLTTNSEEYIVKYGDDVATWLRTEVRTSYLQGTTAQSLEQQIKERFKVDKNKAKLIARNETSTFMGTMEKHRFEQLGIEKAIWRTVQDERVRSSHKHLEGVEFKLKDGAFDDKTKKDIFPKSEINCRCYAEYVIE